MLKLKNKFKKNHMNLYAKDSFKKGSWADKTESQAIIVHTCNATFNQYEYKEIEGKSVSRQYRSKTIIR